MGAAYTLLALKCVFTSALLAQQIHVSGNRSPIARTLGLVAGAVLLAGGGFLVMAKGA